MLAAGVNVDANPETPRCEVSAALCLSHRGATALLSFVQIAKRSDDFVNNHIPLDPPLDGLVF